MNPNRTFAFGFFSACVQHDENENSVKGEKQNPKPDLKPTQNGIEESKKNHHVLGILLSEKCFSPDGEDGPRRREIETRFKKTCIIKFEQLLDIK